MLPGGDEERLEIPAAGDQRHRVPWSEDRCEALREPERPEVCADQLQAPLEIRRKARPGFLRAAEHARARIHAGHLNATANERLGKPPLSDAEDQHRAAGVGQE